MSTHFCPFPFRHIAFTVKGDARLCCESQPLRKEGTNKSFNIREHSVEEIWHSKEYISVRQQFLRGEMPVQCSNCWRREKAGLISTRNFNFTHLPQQAQKQLIENADSDPSELESIEIRFDNTCNQTCRSSDPYSSSKWVQFAEKHGHGSLFKSLYGTKHQIYKYDSKDPIEKFSKVIASVKHIKFLGGEPSLQPAVKTLMRQMILENTAQDKELQFVSNGARPVLELITLFQHFKKVTFMLSIDGYENVNDYVRIGSHWSDTIHVLHEALKLDSRHRLQVNTVVSAYNFLDLADLIRLLRQPQYRRIEHYISFLIEPDLLQVATLPLALQLQGRARLQETLNELPNDLPVFHQLRTYLDTPVAVEQKSQKDFGEHVRLLDKASALKCNDVLPEIWNWLSNENWPSASTTESIATS